MRDRFEATFAVDLAPDEVWRAIARRELDDHAKTRDADAPVHGQVWLPGFDGTAEVLESVPAKLLRLRKDTMPCEGTEIVVTLESVATGTRVTVVQSGFGAFFDVALNWLAIGWDLIVKDLVLYVERGVIAHRHFGLWGPSLGCTFVEKPSGLVIVQVEPQGVAARAGIAAGDHLSSLRQVPVVNTRDIAMVMRTFQPGDAVAVSWLRGSTMMNGSAAL